MVGRDGESLRVTVCELPHSPARSRRRGALRRCAASSFCQTSRVVGKRIGSTGAIASSRHFRLARCRLVSISVPTYGHWRPMHRTPSAVCMSFCHRVRRRAPRWPSGCRWVWSRRCARGHSACRPIEWTQRGETARMLASQRERDERAFAWLFSVQSYVVFSTRNPPPASRSRSGPAG